MSAGLFAAPALGQSNTAFTLRWQAPVGCPQQADVTDRVKALTGVTRGASTSLRAEGTITQTDSTHFHLKLITRSGNLVGERSLDASSCENLSGAAAVSLALLMRSGEPLSAGDLSSKPSDGTPSNGATATGNASTTGSATGSGSATTAATPGSAQTDSTAPKPRSAAAGGTEAKRTAESKTAEPKTDADESDAPPSEIIQRPIREPERKRRFLVQAPLAVMSLGPLPQPSWGVAFAAGAAFEDWRLQLGASAWLRQHIASEESPDFGADIDRLSGVFRACRTLSESRFEASPCLVLSLEHISARGNGPGVTARSEQATWLAVGLGAQGRLKLTNFLGILLGVDAQIETARPVIAIDGVGDLRQLGSAALTATVGPEWIL